VCGICVWDTATLGQAVEGGFEIEKAEPFPVLPPLFDNRMRRLNFDLMLHLWCGYESTLSA
jgi:hypothetical protein